MRAKQILATLAVGGLILGTSQISMAAQSHHPEFKQSIAATVELEFPVLKLDNPMATKAGNRVISRFVHDSMHQVTDDKLVELDTNYVVTYENKDVVSIILKKYTFVDGAANGVNSKQGIVLNRHTGDIVPLAKYSKAQTVGDIMKAVQEGDAVVYSARMKKVELTTTPADLNLSAPAPSYFLDSKGYVCFLFPQGDLASYSEGVTMVKMLK